MIAQNHVATSATFVGNSDKKSSDDENKRISHCFKITFLFFLEWHEVCITTSNRSLDDRETTRMSDKTLRLQSFMRNLKQGNTKQQASSNAQAPTASRQQTTKKLTEEPLKQAS